MRNTEIEGNLVGRYRGKGIINLSDLHHFRPIRCLSLRLHRVVWKTINRRSFRKLLSISALRSCLLLIVTISILSHAIVMCTNTWIHVYSLLYTYMYACVCNFLSVYNIQSVQFISNRWNISKNMMIQRKDISEKNSTTSRGTYYTLVYLILR